VLPRDSQGNCLYRNHPSCFLVHKGSKCHKFVLKVGGLPEVIAKCTMTIKDSVHDSFEVHSSFDDVLSVEKKERKRVIPGTE
jgi:hypothetical protein